MQRTTVSSWISPHACSCMHEGLALISRSPTPSAKSSLSKLCVRPSLADPLRILLF
jgi:hypothetical protein